jgi:hypothetical protein
MIQLFKASKEIIGTLELSLVQFKRQPSLGEAQLGDVVILTTAVCGKDEQQAGALQKNIYNLKLIQLSCRH